MKAKQENTIATDDDDAQGGMTTASEPDLTNDDTADSWSAGEGETDEAIVEEDDDASVGMPTEDESPPPPRSARKRKTPAKKKAMAAAMAKASDGEEETATTYSPPAKKRKTTTTTAKKSGRAKKAAAANGVTSKDFVEGEQEEIDTGILSDSSGLTPAEELSENQEEAKPKRKRKTPAKPRKPRAPKPEPVYVIPDVEKKPNPGYQGRLGYACLNTILRKKKPLPIFCSRTCRCVLLPHTVLWCVPS
jgi:UV DNA damage endonuclease